jgi:serine protease AprX
VVRLEPGRTATDTGLAGAARAVGGSVVSEQPALGTAVVTLPHDGAGELLALPGVRAVSPDRAVTTTSLGFSSSTQAGSMTAITRLTGAQAMWKAGFTGAGIDVAVVDTGTAPVPSLADPVKVAVGPDLSFESQDPDLRYHLDGLRMVRRRMGEPGHARRVQHPPLEQRQLAVTAP